MKKRERQARDAQRLAECRPAFAVRVGRFIARLVQAGERPA